MFTQTPEHDGYIATAFFSCGHCNLKIGIAQKFDLNLKRVDFDPSEVLESILGKH
jgi:hypothetical protein